MASASSTSRFTLCRALSRRFARDEQGMAIVLLALLFPVLMGSVSLAIDMSLAVSQRQKAGAAADAAVLAAVKTASRASSDLSGSTDKAAELGRVRGEAAWAANSEQLTGVSVELNVTYRSGNWTATATYSGQSKAIFSGFLGISSLPISGTATASVGVDENVYTSVYLLLDASHSMALPSTKAGQDFLIATTGCQFACHLPGADYGFNQLRARKYPMRIDTLRSAAVNLVTAAESVNSSTIQIGAWAFDDKMQMVSNLTNNYSRLKSDLAKVDVPKRHNGTQVDDAVRSLAANIPMGGDGSKASAPNTFVFIVTDGVQDGIHTYWLPPLNLRLNPWGWLTASVDPNACSVLKAKNVIVGVLYTTYLPSPDIFYELSIKPKAEMVPAQLKSCASKGFFFEATDDVSINKALSDMFDKAMTITSSPRLVN